MMSVSEAHDWVAVHLWNPPWHVKPHILVAHAGSALAGAIHDVVQLPQ